MLAFVTGATGLLGSNLVRALVWKGYQVRALVRDKEKADRQLGDLPKVEIVTGDIVNVNGFADALDECDFLFHTAAYFREYYARGDSADKLTRLNVAASVNLFTEAARRGVKRAIYTSSGGTVGRKPDGSPGDETTSPAAIATANKYFESKVRAERELKKLALTVPLEILYILPGLMFGPGDAAPTNAGKLVLSFLAQQLPIVPDGGGNTVDARDVAAGMVAAARLGRAGERYIIAGEYREVGEIFQVLSEISKIPAPTRRVPYPLLLAMAWFAERWARWRQSEADLSVAGVRSMHAKPHASSEKAKRELSVTFRPFTETIQDTIQWFDENGYTTKKAQAIELPSAKIISD